MVFVLETGRKILLKKREDTRYQHFLLFPQFFQKFFSFRVVKSQDLHRKQLNHLKIICIFFSIHFTVLALANNKILDWSKLKAFADNKINVTKLLKFFGGRLESIVGKGENAGYQHFLLFLQCFQKASLLRLLKARIVW